MNNDGLEVVKIFLKLLWKMPGYWVDGVTDEEYVKITKYLINKNPSYYGDMVEDREHLFDDETLRKAGYLEKVE